MPKRAPPRRWVAEAMGNSSTALESVEEYGPPPQKSQPPIRNARGGAPVLDVIAFLRAAAKRGNAIVYTRQPVWWSEPCGPVQHGKEFTIAEVEDSPSWARYRVWGRA